MTRRGFWKYGRDEPGSLLLEQSNGRLRLVSWYDDTGNQNSAKETILMPSPFPRNTPVILVLKQAYSSNTLTVTWKIGTAGSQGSSIQTSASAANVGVCPPVTTNPLPLVISGTLMEIGSQTNYSATNDVVTHEFCVYTELKSTSNMQTIWDELSAKWA